MADGQSQRLKTGFGQLLDQVTLTRARRGEVAAIASIYERFGPACYNLAIRVLGERAAAEDIVQEVFLKLFDNLGGYHGEAPFGAWLKRLATNATIDVLRKQRRFGPDGAETVFETLPASEVDSASRVDAWSLLMSLSPRARAVVVLHEIEGYTHREIASLFDQSESYSKSILARALQRLVRVATPIDPKEASNHG